MAIQHHRLSTHSRNTRIVNQINKQNATIPQLVAEYSLPWETLVASLHDDHYNLKFHPDDRDLVAWRVFNCNVTKFNNLMAKVAQNTRAAQASVSKKQISVEVSVSKKQSSTPANTSDVPVQKPQPVVPPQRNDHTISTNTKPNLPSVYLVETGYLLHTSFDKLLSMAKEQDMFMIPRFCVKELMRMSNKPEESETKAKATEVLLKMYSDDIWEKRIFPFEPVESGFIAKTPDVANYKARSFGIAEAAMELYISNNEPRCIHVLTNAMEIHHLVTRMVKNEGLENEIVVTRVYSSK